MSYKPGTDSIEPIGDPDSHDAIRRILSQREPCKVLDIPSGKGALTAFLIERGWDTYCADVDPSLLKVEGVPFEQVDLNRALSYGDESFDAVVCANALHRLYNPGGAVQEFYRILRPGGRMYINANNYSGISARLRFLIGGSIDSRVNEGGAQQTIEAPEANIRFYLLYPQIANMLDRAGFEVIGVTASAVRLQHRLLAPLAWLIGLGSYFIPAKRRKRDHIAIMSGSGILPGGRYFVVEARKPGA